MPGYSGPDGEYYVQDSRQIVGNDMMWWAKDGHGYTCDITKAHIFTRDEAFRLCTDTYGFPRHFIPWPKAYIDTRVKQVVDAQETHLEQAGVVAPQKPKPPRKYAQQCPACGRFISAEQNYTACPHCGEAP